MTADEERFLELKLRTSLRRLARYLSHTTISRFQEMSQNEYQALLAEIGQTAKQYLLHVAYDGLGGYFLKSEIPEMTVKLTQIMNHPKIRRELKEVLLRNPDMEQMRALAMSVRIQVETVILNYQSHIKGE